MVLTSLSSIQVMEKVVKTIVKIAEITEEYND